MLVVLTAELVVNYNGLVAFNHHTVGAAVGVIVGTQDGALIVQPVAAVEPLLCLGVGNGAYNAVLNALVMLGVIYHSLEQQFVKRPVNVVGSVYAGHHNMHELTLGNVLESLLLLVIGKETCQLT